MLVMYLSADQYLQPSTSSKSGGKWQIAGALLSEVGSLHESSAELTDLHQVVADTATAG